MGNNKTECQETQPTWKYLNLRVFNKKSLFFPDTQPGDSIRACFMTVTNWQANKIKRASIFKRELNSHVYSSITNSKDRLSQVFNKFAEAGHLFLSSFVWITNVITFPSDLNSDVRTVLSSSKSFSVQCLILLIRFFATINSYRAVFRCCSATLKPAASFQAIVSLLMLSSIMKMDGKQERKIFNVS